MQNIVIDKKGSQLYSQRNLLIIQHSSFTKPLSIPFSQIQSLTITTQVDLSSTLLTRLAESTISVCVLPSSRSGEACFLLGSWHAGIDRRLQQYDVINNEQSKSYWASILVRLKLHQQAGTLLKIQQRYLLNTKFIDTADVVQAQQGETTDGILKIKSLRNKLCKYYAANVISNRHPSRVYIDCVPKYSIPSLLGTEGVGSAIYFKLYQKFFADELKFQSRNRRPPKDPVNVILSLSYTLLQHLCQQAIYSVGFDPYHGVLHSPSYGRQSLACDFAELQRSTIDFWVWELFDQGILTIDDFSTSSENGYPCELLKSGRSKFYKAFATIRPRLNKTALSHAWLWQHRLQRYHCDDETTLVHQSHSFISQVPEASNPML